MLRGLPKGREIAAHLRRLIREIRSHWPRVEILLRGDGHYCTPEVLDLCRARGVDFILGLPTTAVLRRHVAMLEASTTARAEADEGATIRRFKEFYDGAASWSRVERIIARVEAGPRGCDTRFIVTSLTRGTGKTLYEGVYCARGQAENHIKAWKIHLAADRTSCTSAAANQLRVRRAYAAPLGPRSRFTLARWCLLAYVDAARRPAQALDLAARPDCYPAPARREDRRPRRRDEDPHHPAPAERLSRRTPHPPAARAAAAHGADLTASPAIAPAHPETETPAPDIQSSAATASAITGMPDPGKIALPTSNGDIRRAPVHKPG